MKRIIQISEEELDILINRAYFQGICAQDHHKFNLTGPVTPAFQELRDNMRESLKAEHFRKN